MMISHRRAPDVRTSDLLQSLSPPAPCPPPSRLPTAAAQSLAPPPMASRPIIPIATPSPTESMRKVASTSTRISGSNRRSSASAEITARERGSHSAETLSSTDLLPPSSSSLASTISTEQTDQSLLRVSGSEGLTSSILAKQTDSISLSVTGCEQVVVDPRNRDAVLRPRRGDTLPETHEMCTAFSVDVFRASDGLKFSIPVRYSRFDRLQQELARELPHLRSLLPALPSKRGPLDRLFSKGGLPDPRMVEERTHQLHEYLQTLMKLPGVVESAAVRDLLALSAPAEAAIRKAREEAASNDEARQQQMSELSRELSLSSSYARAQRLAKDRAETRLSSVQTSLESSAAFIDRLRDLKRLASVWRVWDALVRRSRDERRNKEVQAASFRLSSQSIELADMRKSLDQTRESLRRVQAQQRATTLQLEHDRSHHSRILQEQRDAASAAQQALAAERDQALARADAAAQAASAAHAQLRAIRSDLSATTTANSVPANTVAESDEVARLRAALEDATTTGMALQQQVVSERRRRILASLRSSLEQRAGEARLLLLLRSQRERIDETSRELAEARHQASLQLANPALEAAWLAAPPPALVEAPFTEPKEEIDTHAIDMWKRDWLAAMAHCL